ncbi:hypothetical protein KUTeg_020604 [Tegillarca granosa]|uniref:Uncharacterized protein n=1 Tax=Tegillarca granosa TaxID=220873 RepID=A0ABQ9EDH6_TEGGR|nr:hypothetical protein KUTeg_020604 [Tegillarca granosa]
MVLSKLQNQMTLLNSFCISYDDLKNTSNDPDSLNEIKRKQNERESLINVTNACFHFFTKLECLCREKVTHLSLSEQRKKLFNHVKEELLKDSNLFNCWLKEFSQPNVGEDPSGEGDEIENIVSSMTEICENCIDLFNFVVNLFLKVSFSQFRRDYLAFLKKEKGKALRKKD